MDEEIDLWAYVAVLLKYKYWIVGLAFVAAVVTLGISFLLPPAYEATALVAITQPKYAMQFDPRFELTNRGLYPPYQAYPLLAMGDEILSKMIEELGSELAPEERTLARVREMLKAENSTDPSIVQLTVRNGDPNRAAAIANRWATLFVKAANQLYGEGEAELAFFEEQLADAESALSQAEQDLIAFQARNEASILSAQLDNKQAALDEFLSVARSLRLIIHDAQSLQDRLRSQEATTIASLSDELTSLLLEIDALNRSRLPIQLQIPVQQSMGNRTVGEQVAFLGSLIQVLENKLVILEQEAQVLEPDILSLQEQLQKVETEEERLTMATEVAKETFMSLSRKVAEAKIAAQDTTGDVRLASRATVPDEPASSGKLLKTAIAGTLGLLIGVLGAFAVEYWRRGQPEGRSAR